MLFLLLTASTPSAHAASLNAAANICHTEKVAIYSSPDETTSAIVRSVRAACLEEEEAFKEASILALMDGPTAVTRERAEAVVRKAVDRGYTNKVTKMVVKARLSRTKTP